MKQWKRILYYLFLNVLVSACTTLAVLIFWDRTQSPIPGGLLSFDLNPSAAATATVPAGPQITSAPVPTATPEFVTYQVKSGDTFESIAAEFSVNVDDLILVNGFTQSQPLGEGEMLRIPVDSPASGSVAIDQVFGVGDLASERVLLEHEGEGELSLVGWQLEDEDGNVFVFPEFPQLVLFKDGAVNVYSRGGTNTVAEMFWGLEQPVWERGEVVTLRNQEGQVVTTFTVP